MNANAKKWIAALRSGRFRQGKMKLHKVAKDGKQGDQFCCLGVACYLAVQNGVDLEVEKDSQGFYIYGDDDQGGVLPPEVVDWLGMKENNLHGNYGNREGWELGNSLVKDNDNGKSFEEIADIIENEPQGLFR